MWTYFSNGDGETKHQHWRAWRKLEVDWEKVFYSSVYHLDCLHRNRLFLHPNLAYLGVSLYLLYYHTVYSDITHDTMIVYTFMARTIVSTISCWDNFICWAFCEKVSRFDPSTCVQVFTLFLSLSHHIYHFTINFESHCLQILFQSQSKPDSPETFLASLLHIHWILNDIWLDIPLLLVWDGLVSL